MNSSGPHDHGSAGERQERDASESHARDALEAGVELLGVTGHADGDPWVPIGIGVNTGVAYVGAVGTDEHVEFTALGDVVNVTARLSAAAAPGELLATSSALQAADMSGDGLEHRRLMLKGKSEATDVAVLSAAGPSTATRHPG